jgi:hypothetical protein
MQTKRDLLSPDDLSALATGETTLRSVDRSRERDAIQRYFDALITEAYDKWVEAGKPTARRDRPALRVDSPTEDLAHAVYKRLRASAAHLDVGISLDGPHRLGENRWRVAFSAQDKRPRSPKGRS